MKRSFCFILAIVIFTLHCADDNSPTRPLPQTPPSASMLEKQAYDLVNAYRLSKGLKALAWNDVVAEQARLHSRNMAAGIVEVGHDGFDQRAQAIGQSIAWARVGENVAYNRGYADPAVKAVDGWLNSPGHLKNILGDFGLSGMGAAVNDQGEYYFTQMFVKVH